MVRKHISLNEKENQYFPISHNQPQSSASSNKPTSLSAGGGSFEIQLRESHVS